MPVFMVPVTAKVLDREEQWSLDLHRIYSEADALRLCLEGETLDANAFIQEALAKDALEKKERWFAAALFNDHLIGAVLVTEKPQAWYLQHLCVREVTRRRGVGSRLMTLVATEGRNRGHQVCVPRDGLTPADEMLVRRLGYLLDFEQRCFKYQG